MRWKLKKNRKFDIHSFYNELQGSSSVVFPWKGTSRVKTPQRVSFSVWTVAWGQILTNDNLSSRGFSFVDWCAMCHCCGETQDHLLLIV